MAQGWVPPTTGILSLHIFVWTSERSMTEQVNEKRHLSTIKYRLQALIFEFFVVLIFALNPKTQAIDTFLVLSRCNY